MTNDGKSFNFVNVVKVLILILTIVLQIALFVAVTLKVTEYANYFTYAIEFIAIIFSINIMCRSGSTADKMSWVFFILALPATGIFLYLVFGGTRFGKVLGRKIEAARKNSEQYLVQDAEVFDEIKDKQVRSELNLIKNSSRYPVYKDTDVTYYEVGEKYFAAMCEELEKAEKFIFVEYFIFADGQMYRKLFDILGKKAMAGVDVRVIYDPAGSTGILPKDMDIYCKQTGIKCMPFNPFSYNLYSYGSYRSHRKITVIDGNVGFTGGINIGDEYINVASKLGHWKDMGIRLRGDGVFSLTVMFLDGWKLVSDVDTDANLFRPTQKFPSTAYVAPFDDAPLDDYNPAALNYKKLITNSTEYLYITTPYLIIDPEMTACLTLAAQSGVDVRIITPHIPDKAIIFQSTRAHYRNLVDGGVRIFEYEPGFVHGKVLVSDDKTSFVGSINFDYRSLAWNYECGAYVYDETFAKTVKADMENTLSKCIEITADTIKSQNIAFRAFQGVLRLVSPLL